MVYTSRYGTERPKLETGSVRQSDQLSFSALLDPGILQAARHIYRTYYEVHPDQVKKPLGVAIDRFTHRGKLIFGGKPVLLPQECFVPINQIESEIH